MTRPTYCWRVAENDQNPAHSPMSPRTTVRRGAKRAHYDPAEIRAVLRDGLIAHVAVNTEQGPLVLPMVYGIDGDTMYLHGALANSLLKAGADNEVCATVTIVDGLVFAKNAFNHSMNYRSVVVRGKARVVTDAEENDRALRAMTDHVVATWDTVRPPNESELRATRVVAIPLDEMSAKIRRGGAINEEIDADAAVWSGHVPMTTTFGAPVTNDDAGAPVPSRVAALQGRDAHSR